VVCSYAQLRTRQTHPGVQGGGLGYGRGIPSLGQAAAGWLTAGRCYGPRKNRRKRGRACSPPQQRVGDNLVDAEAAVAEIEVAAELRAAVDLQCGGACGGEEEVQEAQGECEGAAAGLLGVLL
jgi:hypothetical protein